MATIVTLPRLSDTMEEGVVAKWHVAVGDRVKRGQAIADIETDKATMEFESFDAGTVLALVADIGQTLPIGAPIAVLGKPGEDAKAALAQGVTPTAGVDGGSSAGSPVASSAPAPPNELAPAPARPGGDTSARIPASPLARRVAREHGLTLAQIPGSGPRGRVVLGDVEAAAARGHAPGAAPRGPARGDEVLRLSQMRKAIARRMAQSNAEIPHFDLTAVIDMNRAAALRAELIETYPDTRISYNDMVLLACARALRQHPDVNAYWNGETIVRRGEVHLGVAVAVDEGLVVPAIRRADELSLFELAAAVRSVGTRARDRKLDPSEMTGSTFTVSNLGMFGIESFVAVINPGEGAILAVGQIADEAVVRAGAIVVGKRMRVTLSGDHRAMDGATGAKFLQRVRELLEQPLRLLELRR